MNSKTISNAVILLITIAIVVVVNLMVGWLGLFNFRVDLTEKGVFTLSDGTRRIIEGLNPDKPVTIRFYATTDSRLMPQWGQTYGNTVRDLLLEITKASGNKITLENIDPRPNTEEEDKAVADDIQGYTVNEEGDKAYFGLAIHSLGKKEVIPTLTPAEEGSLEYQIARALSQVTRTKRSVVGVMSPMPIAGPAFNFPPMMQQNQQRPWIAIQQLRLDYDVREVPMSTEAIDSDINILLVIHPADISQRAEFAIDQFLLKGGKVIAFVDPHSLVSRAYNNPGQMGRAPTTFISPNSDLPTLFKEWGVGYDKNLVVADMVFRTANNRRAVPTFLSITKDGINATEPVTEPLQLVQMFSAGSFNVAAKGNIVATTLIHSSEKSQLIDTTDAEKAMREDLKDFQSSGKSQVMGVRLSGRFKSAFPDGQPKAAAPAPEGPGGMPGGFPGGLPPGMFPGGTGGENDKPAGAPAEEKKAEAKPSLKESANNDGVVFLFSDVDMEYDEFVVERDPMGGPSMRMGNSNLPLLLNTVEMLAGGADLIAVRSRSATNRPFTKIQELDAAIDEKFRPRLQKIEQEINDVAQEIVKAGGAKATQGLIVLNPNEEQAKQLQEKQVEHMKKKREILKEKTREKDIREFLVTAANMLGVPLLIVAVGIVIAVRRRAMQAAH